MCVTSPSDVNAPHQLREELIPGAFSRPGLTQIGMRAVGRWIIRLAAMWTVAALRTHWRRLNRGPHVAAGRRAAQSRRDVHAPFQLRVLLIAGADSVTCCMLARADPCLCTDALFLVRI